MIIKLHKGYGDIVFGSSRSTIIEQLGEPNERTNEAYADAIDVEYFEYSFPNLSLGFSSDDGDRLGTITVRDEGALLIGRKVIGRAIEEVFRENHKLVLDDDFEEFGKNYIDESNDLSFWVNDGKVTNVAMFPGWIDKNSLG